MVERRRVCWGWCERLAIHNGVKTEYRKAGAPAERRVKLSLEGEEAMKGGGRCLRGEKRSLLGMDQSLARRS